MVPQSKTFTRRHRNKSAEFHYDNPYSQTKPSWCVAALDRAPLVKPRAQSIFGMVFLDIFTTESDALNTRNELQKQNNNSIFIVFQLGNWITLPIPRWLSTVEEIITYNRKLSVNLIERMLQRDKVFEEVVKRRTSRTTNGDYISAQEELERIERTEIIERKPEATVSTQKKSWDVEYKTEEYDGLMWALPELQTSKPVDSVTFVLLGAFSDPEELEQARREISISFPEFSIFKFPFGHPISIPPPIWLLQATGAVIYDQPILKDLMSRSTIEDDDEEVEEKNEDVDDIVEQLVGSIEDEEPEKSETDTVTDHGDGMFKLTLTQKFN